MIEKNKINALLSSGGETNIELAYQLAKSQALKDDFYYLIRFGDMLQYLRSFSHIEIIRFSFLPPNFDEISGIEMEIDKSLNAAVKKFYSQCNGMSLYWLD